MEIDFPLLNTRISISGTFPKNGVATIPLLANSEATDVHLIVCLIVSRWFQTVINQKCNTHTRAYV